MAENNSNTNRRYTQPLNSQFVEEWKQFFSPIVDKAVTKAVEKYEDKIKAQLQPQEKELVQAITKTLANTVLNPQAITPAARQAIARTEETIPNLENAADRAKQAPVTQPQMQSADMADMQRQQQGSRKRKRRPSLASNLLASSLLFSAPSAGLSQPPDGLDSSAADSAEPADSNRQAQQPQTEAGHVLSGQTPTTPAAGIAPGTPAVGGAQSEAPNLAENPEASEDESGGEQPSEAGAQEGGVPEVSKVPDTGFGGIGYAQSRKEDTEDSGQETEAGEERGETQNQLQKDKKEAVEDQKKEKDEKEGKSEEPSATTNDSQEPQLDLGNKVTLDIAFSWFMESFLSICALNILEIPVALFLLLYINLYFLGWFLPALPINVLFFTKRFETPSIRHWFYYGIIFIAQLFIIMLVGFIGYFFYCGYIFKTYGLSLQVIQYYGQMKQCYNVFGSVGWSVIKSFF